MGLSFFREKNFFRNSFQPRFDRRRRCWLSSWSCKTDRRRRQQRQQQRQRGHPFKVVKRTEGEWEGRESESERERERVGDVKIVKIRLRSAIQGRESKRKRGTSGEGGGGDGFPPKFLPGTRNNAQQWGVSSASEMDESGGSRQSVAKSERSPLQRPSHSFSLSLFLSPSLQDAWGERKIESKQEYEWRKRRNSLHREMFGGKKERKIGFNGDITFEDDFWTREIES